jgi:hypothetical protein
MEIAGNQCSLTESALLSEARLAISAHRPSVVREHAQ